MTPAVKTLQRARTSFVLHQYEHDPACDSYGEEAARMLGVEEDRVFKTLVAKIDEQTLVVAVVPVSHMLDLKALAKAQKAKRAAMADRVEVERATGYVVGGVSPLGQKKRLTTFIDETARSFATIFISGGKRGLDIELAPQDLAALTQASFAPLGK